MKPESCDRMKSYRIVHLCTTHQHLSIISWLTLPTAQSVWLCQWLQWVNNFSEKAFFDKIQVESKINTSHNQGCLFFFFIFGNILEFQFPTVVFALLSLTMLYFCCIKQRYFRYFFSKIPFIKQATAKLRPCAPRYAPARPCAPQRYYPYIGLKLLRKASQWQLIKCLAPSIICWCQCDIRIEKE